MLIEAKKLEILIIIADKILEPSRLTRKRYGYTDGEAIWENKILFYVGIIKMYSTGILLIRYMPGLGYGFLNDRI